MKIMVCYDGSDIAKKALELTIKYAKAFDADVIVVTVLESDTGKQLSDIEKAEQILQYAKNFLSIELPNSEAKMLPPNNVSVGENIISLADAENMDKIIIGVEKKSKVGKFFFGSTAQYLILSASCEVIAVK